MRDICVVHLVRACNGIEPYKQFVASYSANPAGTAHDLVVVFKGFDHPSDANPYRELLGSLQHEALFVTDEGFDITAYFTALHSLRDRYHYFCFLNSYSEILDPNWLQKLREAFSNDDVTVAGATGSWNSNYSNSIAWFRSVFEEIVRRTRKGAIASSDTQPSVAVGSTENRADLAMVLRVARNFWFNINKMIFFKPFPNYHLRTNAFMIKGTDMQSIRYRTLVDKMDAYKFESGRRGFTMQILNRNQRAVVVGRDGIVYDKETWDRSNTFWSKDQGNLLVADNQTRDYAHGNAERRTYLSTIAWGKDHSDGYRG